MKKTILNISLSILILFTASNLTAKKSSGPALKNDVDRVSYAIGVQIGEKLKFDGTEINLKLMYQAIKDVLAGKEPVMTKDEIRDTMMELSKKTMEEREQRNAKAGKKNLEQGKAFLEKSRNEKGMQTTPSGLQYLVIKEGAGDKPTTDDTVKVHYKGTLISGETFDSSYDRGEPVEFPLKSVIPGLTEGLHLMKIGAKYKFIIPPDLAYGENAPPSIGPNQVLIFEVELLEIK